MAESHLRITLRKAQLLLTIQQMKKDLMELEPNERLRIITGLLDFFIPKLNRTDHTLKGKKDIIIVQLPTPSTPNAFNSANPGRLGAVSEESIEVESGSP